MEHTTTEMDSLRCRVVSFIDYARKQAYVPDAVDYSPCYSRPENRCFMAEHNIDEEDIRNCITDLKLKHFSHISVEKGKTDAYVFGFPLVWDGSDVYMKLKKVDGILVLSFHEPDRALSFPFQGEEEI